MYLKEESIELGCLKIIPESRKFFIKNKSINLKNKEFTLMNYFMQNSGKVISRARLLEEVWDRNIFCITNTVDVHVSKLRQKINKHLDNDVIKTIHCVGYILEIDNNY